MKQVCSSCGKEVRQLSKHIGSFACYIKTKVRKQITSGLAAYPFKLRRRFNKYKIEYNLEVYNVVRDHEASSSAIYALWAAPWIAEFLFFQIDETKFHEEVSNLSQVKIIPAFDNENTFFWLRSIPNNILLNKFIWKVIDYHNKNNIGPNVIASKILLSNEDKENYIQEYLMNFGLEKFPEEYKKFAIKFRHYLNVKPYFLL